VKKTLKRRDSRMDPCAELAASQGDEQALLRDLERRVSWQVSIAYGLALAEPEPAVEVVTRVDPVVERTSIVADTPFLPVPHTAPLPTVAELEHLVGAREAAEPARAEEWLWSLSHLREFADEEGRLPEDFRATVEIVFRELLQEPRVAAAA
jgi:hypothetical protein